MTIALHFEYKITKTFYIHKKSELFYCFSLLSKNAPSHLKALFSFYSIFFFPPLHSLKTGVTLTYGTRQSLTYGTRETLTPFEAVEEPF